MVDINTEEVADFIGTMKSSRQDLERALDMIDQCSSAEGWNDSNRTAFDVAAKSLIKEVETAIDEINDTIKELEKIVDKANDIKF